MSEGKFYKVMEEELRALKVACQRFENYNPTITFVVVHKRHHTRFEYFHDNLGIVRKDPPRKGE